MTSWVRLRQLRQDRLIKPVDVERISRSIAESNGRMEYFISAVNLAEIENGLVPDIHKICSLATCLKVSYGQLLLIFGIDVMTEWPKNNHSPRVKAANQQSVDVQPLEIRPVDLTPVDLSKDGLDFRLKFNSRISLQQTRLLAPDPRRWGNMPSALLKRLTPARFRYAWIGWQDDAMADILPPGSLVEIDKKQREAKRSCWKALQERPLYLARHNNRYSCCWCQLEGNELTLVPNPISQRKAMHFQTPQQAMIVGKVVNVWMPPQLRKIRPEGMDMLSAYSRQSPSSGFTAMFESGRID